MGNLFIIEFFLVNWDILVIIKVIIVVMIYNRVILLICFSIIFIKIKNINWGIIVLYINIRRLYWSL